MRRNPSFVVIYRHGLVPRRDRGQGEAKWSFLAGKQPIPSWRAERLANNPGAWDWSCKSVMTWIHRISRIAGKCDNLVSGLMARVPVTYYDRFETVVGSQAPGEMKRQGSCSRRPQAQTDAEQMFVTGGLHHFRPARVGHQSAAIGGGNLVSAAITDPGLLSMTGAATATSTSIRLLISAFE